MPTHQLTEVQRNVVFGGIQYVYSHDSSETKCRMNFSIYLPKSAAGEGTSGSVPVVYWLSGLTCTEKNFIEKSGAQRYASELGLAIVCPDTSPRGCNIDGEDDGWDFGTGAGFYVDATEDKWSRNYRMYSYVTNELPKVIEKNFPQVDASRQSIVGHSMGGHGALICFLKNPGKYRYVSAFAPISNPINCAWGKKCFSNYLGPNTDQWTDYDATELVKSSAYKGHSVDILIDVGTSDQFLNDGQLLCDNLAAACSEKGLPLTLRKQPNYDHSYYFIATFIGEHLARHAEALRN